MKTALKALLLIPLVVNASDYVDTGKFNLYIDPINSCFEVKPKDKRINCFGEAVEQSRAKSKNIKSEVGDIIKSGKANFVDPSSVEPSQQVSRQLEAYLRRIICGGVDCELDKFGEVKSEYQLFVDLMNSERKDDIRSIVADFKAEGIEPRYSEILTRIDKNTHVTEVPENILARMKKVFAEENPDDFHLQKLLIERAKESYLELANMNNIEGLPNDLLSKIKAKFLKENPDDYYLQLLLVKQQIKAYLELDN